MTGPIHPMVPVLNTPSKPQVQGAGSGRSQKDRRFNDTFRDMHRHPVRFPPGRPWCGPREIAANRESTPLPPDGFVMGDLMRGEYVENDDGSCNRALTLASVWYAPWTPLAKYFRYNYARKLITFDYALMRREEEQGLDKYYEAASELGFQLNIRVEPDVLPHAQIVRKLGKPSRMNRIAEAAMAGDPWLLGFIDEPNPELAAILDIHPVRGIRASYQPPVLAVPQEQAVEAILSAPPNTDFLKMLAEMAASAAAAAVDRALEKRDEAAAEKKRKDKAHMDKIRPKRAKAEPVEA